MRFLEKLGLLHESVPKIYLDRIKEQEQIIARQADKIASLRELILVLENKILVLQEDRQ